MRKYFIRTPYWVRGVYPSATWTRDENIDAEGHLHITIDDGPHPKSTPKWLDLLNRTEQTATFFLLGSAALLYPSIVEEIKSEGHSIASHGMDHWDGGRVDTTKYVDQVLQSLELLECHRFRPPYGRMTPVQYRRLLKKCDIYLWSMMPGDFDQRASESDMEARLKCKRESDIIVFHDTPSAFSKVERAFLSTFS